MSIFHAAKRIRFRFYADDPAGGSVVLGPGCLCFSVILPIHFHQKLASIRLTNSWVLRHVTDALKELGHDTLLCGDTDVSYNGFKISGNAQRRTRNAVLFHGTLLYNFTLSKISDYLLHPPMEPSYRNQRKHAHFLTQLPVQPNAFKRLFIQVWKAQYGPPPNL